MSFASLLKNFSKDKKLAQERMLKEEEKAKLEAAKKPVYSPVWDSIEQFNQTR